MKRLLISRVISLIIGLIIGFLLAGYPQPPKGLEDLMVHGNDGTTLVIEVEGRKERVSLTSVHAIKKA